MGDAGGPLIDLLLDMGQLVGRRSNEAAHISGAGDNGKPKVIKACLGSLNHREFNDEDWLG